MFDGSITASVLVQVAAYLVGCLVVFVTLRVTVLQLGKDVSELKTDIRELNKIVVATAVANQRISEVDQRVSAIEKDVRELRHGHGFVREALSREYPSPAR